MFHALGRLLYNKREGDEGAEQEKFTGQVSQQAILQKGANVVIPISHAYIFPL